jgi:transaldolase
VTRLTALKIKIFADGADKAGMLEMAKNPLIKGFTTNPTLMRKAGIQDYKAFAQDVLLNIPNLPVSFEVFSDEFVEMERQARLIASWGPNVYVKIPVTNTRGASSGLLIQKLSSEGIKLNVTALTHLRQVSAVAAYLDDVTPAYISVFAGRVADTGVDAFAVMREAKYLVKFKPNIEIIWASPRELYNIFQADAAGVDIITVSNDILKKLPLIGKDLDEYSLDTVKMFYEDGKKAGFML